MFYWPYNFGWWPLLGYEPGGISFGQLNPTLYRRNLPIQKPAEPTPFPVPTTPTKSARCYYLGCLMYYYDINGTPKSKKINPGTWVEILETKPPMSQLDLIPVKVNGEFGYIMNYQLGRV